MTETERRNQRVTEILKTMYSQAINDEYIVDDSLYKESLDKLFSTEVWGFREILLVVIVGMSLDSDFRASTGFYDCNPRAIYETPIKEFLIAKNIPHRKSGPLNVAKATAGLDETWAAQRRPRAVADEVVRIIELIENDPELITDVGVSLLRRLIVSAENVQQLAVEITPSTDPDYLYNLSYELISKTPDAGNTPQRIAAFLLKCYHRFMHTGIVVTGGEDRASVTSTTSKKPGDINEERQGGAILKVYEITVKPFDLARIRDSYDCVKIYNDEAHDEIKEIIVICRREDCPPNINQSNLHGYFGNYVYQDIIYYFWDIFEWVSSMLQRMTGSAREAYYCLLNAYIDDINTARSVKELWRELHT